MKKLLKLSSVFTVLMLLNISCAVDDDAAIVASSVDTATISLNKTGDQTVTQDETSYDVSIVLSEASDTETQVEYTLNGADQVAYMSPGETSAVLTFQNGLGVVNNVVLTNVRGLYNSGLSIDSTQNSVTFLGIPTMAIPAEPDVTLFTLAWEDAGAFDMDFFLFEGDQDLGGNIVDSSLGFTNTETVRLDDTATDQTYSLYVNQFAFTADVGALIIVTKSDGTTEYYGGVVSQNQFVLTFVKSGTDLTFTSLL